MKRSQIKRRPLADTVIGQLDPEAKEYWELDSTGLYFRVKSSGVKSGASGTVWRADPLLKTSELFTHNCSHRNFRAIGRQMYYTNVK